MIPASRSDVPDEWRELLAGELHDLGASLPPHVWDRVLLAPARDLLARPAKQFRASLVRLAWRLAGGAAAGPPPVLTAAVEILHAGSLIIDDIEDDGEIRRGAPAIHRTYGVPVALNCGNWMYFVAFALVDRAPLPEATRLALHRAMLRGSLACHQGQALDLGHDVTAIAHGELRAVVDRATALKAGALTQLAAELGAIAAGADDTRRLAIGELGLALGTGLQMLDDLGAVTSPARADKWREDLWHLRPTWSWVWMAEAADEASWHRAVRNAREVARHRGDPAPLARVLAGFAAAGGRIEASGRLHRALAAVRAFADAETYAAIAGELARVESSYG